MIWNILLIFHARMYNVNVCILICIRLIFSLFTFVLSTWALNELIHTFFLFCSAPFQSINLIYCWYFVVSADKIFDLFHSKSNLVLKWKKNIFVTSLSILVGVTEKKIINMTHSAKFYLYWMSQHVFFFLGFWFWLRL